MLVIAPQVALWCACGNEQIGPDGACARCLRRRRLSRELFGGHRETVLERDGERCQVCGEVDGLVVHHRRPGLNAKRYMIALCRGCHARIHHTLQPRIAWTEALLALWREVHRGHYEQLRLPLTPSEMERAALLSSCVKGCWDSGLA